MRIVIVKMVTTHANRTRKVSESTVELLPLEGSTSEVWKHFGFPDRNGKFIETDKKKCIDVCCKLCKKALKYCGNTSNLRSHLEQDHKKEFQELLEVEAEKVKEKSDGGASSSKQPKIVGSEGCDTYCLKLQQMDSVNQECVLFHWEKHAAL